MTGGQRYPFRCWPVPCAITSARQLNLSSAMSTQSVRGRRAKKHHLPAPGKVGLGFLAVIPARLPARSPTRLRFTVCCCRRARRAREGMGSIRRAVRCALTQRAGLVHALGDRAINHPAARGNGVADHQHQTLTKEPVEQIWLIPSRLRRRSTGKWFSSPTLAAFGCQPGLRSPIRTRNALLDPNLGMNAVV